MCTICTMFEKDKLTYYEAKRAIMEMSTEDSFRKEHLQDALDFIENKELDKLNKDEQKL